MGYISDQDTNHEHEGWVAMTYADGAVSSGTSDGTGRYLDGYTYRADHSIDPAFLRPFSATTGWLPTCECGWRGIEVPIPDGVAERWREPSDEQEDMLMYQWRLHMRDACADVSA